VAIASIAACSVARTEISPADAFAGSRVYVRFNHGVEPIAYRVLRAIKQTFLSHFHV
jgi:hypothetical protein